MMKGIMSIIEVMITGMILFIAFLHFFPQYTIRSKWDKALLIIKVRDTLNTIDRMNKTYDFAISPEGGEFDKFMNRTFKPETTGGVVVWWKSVDLTSAPSYSIPYFTEGYKESIVDVYNDTAQGFKVYSFTLGMGYPY